MRYCAVLGGVVAGACETGIKHTATIAAPDSAYQVLFGMSHYVTDAEIQRAHVQADTAYFYSPAQTAELRNVHITFYDTRGAETSTLTSRQGTYHWRSGDMEARGNVVVVRTDSATGRPCKMIIDSVGRQAQQVEVRRGETNVFAGGGVLAHCEGTSSTLASDSVAWFAGVKRFDMLGQKNPVHIRDTAMTLDVTTAAYFMGQERLEAHKNVIAVNRKTGSVLRGPNLTYYRAVRGVRDTLEMYASGRPTIDYRATADSGGGEPYIIVADRVRFKGNERMWGGGQVTIDRSDFAARGDSMQLDQTSGFAVLVGKPRVQGKGPRPYALTGTRIELGLQGQEIRLVKALGDGVATGADWRLTADTIHLHLDRKKLQVDRVRREAP